LLDVFHELDGGDRRHLGGIVAEILRLEPGQALAAVAGNAEQVFGAQFEGVLQ